ncbi:MAG: DUF2298 domain-containing protein [Anaerolineae bacterium]
MFDLIIWYLWVQLFALVGWLVASRWLRGLPDRGYAISKALGLILTGFVFWLSVTAKIATNNAGGVLFAMALVAGFGLLLKWRDDRAGNILSLRQLLPARNVIIATEVIFAFSFLLCASYRAYNPNIESAGGEKFMEMMFINAIIRSPAFPPNDAWLSGFSISYYYFGYVIFAMLIEVSGVAPAVGFNLGGAMIFALAATSAFGVGYNLWASRKPAPSPQSLTSGKAPILAGLVTAIMLAFMGNLGGLIEAGRCAGVVSQSTWQWMDIHNKEAANSTPECTGLAPNKFYWWWNWSRVVHDTAPGGADVEVITESPAFSFILGDNHPHVMALPFVLVAATIALSFFLGNLTLDEQKRQGRSSFDKLRMSGSVFPDLLLTAIVAGGLSFMNTWDFPVYGALIVGGLLLHHVLARKPLMPAIVFSVAVFALGYVLYLPFYAMFSSQAKGIGVNAFSGTRPIQFFLMFATFVCAIPGFLWMAFREGNMPVREVVRKTARVTAGLMAFVLGAAAIATLFWPEARAYAAELNANGSVMGVTRAEIFQSASSRLPTLITPALLLAVAAICGVLVWMRTRRNTTETPSTNSPTPFVLLLIMGGALLTASVEFIFLRDNFGTRMNTVFKFYYMAWVVWSLASGYALMTFLTTRGVLAKISAGLVIFCMAAGLLYPIFAASSRTNGFKTTPTLDGAAFIKGFAPADAAVMDWLNKNVRGAPIILEAPGDKYASYKYEGRISVFTGLPTLLGWGGHQSQWRGNYDEPARREPDIEDLFRSADMVLTQSLLKKYNVQYVIVGETERQRYPAEGLAKFDSLGSVAFKSGNTVVYRVR